MKSIRKRSMHMEEGRCKGMSLWNSMQENKRIGSPQSCSHNKRPLNRETSLCICQKASYTVEAVVIIPLMAAFFASILFCFRILQIQVTVEEALVYAGRKTAVESSVVASEDVLLASAKGYFLYALKDNLVVEEYVRGGVLGIFLLGSDCDEEVLTLRASYEVTMPIAFWKIGRIPLYSTNSFQKWNGDQNIVSEEEWVYITDNGTVYHTALSCQTLDLSLREVEFSQIERERGKDGQKYYACSHCCIGKDEGKTVYCTDYGTLYHRELSCRYLKRTVKRISREEVGERLLCSFCSGG